MRIIAGEAKGRKLLSPIGKNTRPTLDRVKESIFDIIQFKVYGSVVLDAFSGTGSLGLEAVSRGAKKCYLVDKSVDTFNILKKNIISLKFQDRCECVNKDSYEYLRLLSKKNIKFDIIFIDPPYSKEMIPPAIEIIYDKNLLLKSGIIVTKIDSREKLYTGFKNIKLYDHRKYGNTTICFYRIEEENND